MRLLPCFVGWIVISMGAGWGCRGADLVIRWSRELGSPITASPGLLPSGEILIGTQGTPNPDSSDQPNRNGFLRALRPDGTEVWRVAMFGGIAATPHVAPDGAVYAGSLGSWGTGCRLYRLREGAVEWSRAQERQVLVPGALGHGDRVYFLHAMGGVLAWRTNGTPAWERSYTGTLSWMSEAAVMADGTVLVGLGRGVGQLVALDPEAGEERWSADAYGILGPPQVAQDGTIYFGGGAGDAPNAGEVTPPPGLVVHGVRAHNPDGSFVWSFATSGRIQGAPVISGTGTIFVADDGGTVTALDRMGRRVWSQSVGSPVLGSPALASDGTLYVATVDGRLLALSEAGEVRGTMAVGGELRASPLILPDGLVVVAGMDGKVHAVQGTAGPAQGPALGLRDPRRSGRDDSVAPGTAPTGLHGSAAEDGIGVRLQWDDLGAGVTYEVMRGGPGDERPGDPVLVRFLRGTNWVDRAAPTGRTLFYSVRARNAGGIGPWTLALAVVRPVAGLGEVVWLHENPRARGAVALGPDGAVHTLSGEGVLRSLDADGRLRWAFTNDTVRFTETPVVLESGRVAVGGSEAFRAGGPMHLLDAEGREVGAIPNLAAGRLPAVEAGDALVYPSWDEGLTRRLPDGTLAWTLSSSSGWSTPSLWADGTVFQPGSRLLDSAGTMLWIATTEAAAVHAALGRDGTAYMGGVTGGVAGLVAVGTDGAPRWSVALAGGLGGPPIVLADDSIVAGSLAGEVLRVNPDGSVRWRYQAGAGLPASGAAVADGMVWFGTDDGRLLGLDAEGALRVSLKLGARIDSPPAVGADGRVVVAVEGVGVVAVQGSGGPGDAPWPMFRADAARRGRGVARSVAPSEPVGVSALEGEERGAVTVSWQPVSFAESYDILRGPGSDPAGMTEVRRGVTGATSFADRDTEPGVVWHYRVRARNRLGASALSASASGSQSFRRWGYSTAAGIWGTPAVATDGSLRVSVGRVPGPESGLVALGADGRVRWRVEGVVPTGSPVMGVGDVAYVAVNERELAAVDMSGGLLWRRGVTSSASQSIALDGDMAITGDGLILVPIEEGPLVAFDAEGREVWRNTSVRCFRATAPVVSDDGAVVVPAALGPTMVLERNGVRRFNLALPPQSRPALTAAGEWLGFGDGRLVRVSPTGVTNLSVRVLIGSHPLTTVLVEPDGGVLLTTERLGITALRSDGTVRWQGTNGQWRAALPAAALLADGSVVSVEGGTLVARDRADGRILWQSVVGSTLFGQGLPGPRRSPVVTPAGLVIYVGPTNLVAFGPVTNTPSEGWPMDRLNGMRTANRSGPAPVPSALRAIATSAGSWVEQVRLGWATNGDLAGVEIWGGTSPNREEARLLGAVPFGQFQFAHRNVSAGVVHHYWLRATNRAGVSDWSEPVNGNATPGVSVRWTARATTNLLTVAVGQDRRLHAVEGVEAGGRLWTWEETGTLAWSVPLESRPTSGPMVAPDGTVRVLERGHLATVDAQGVVRSRVALGNETVGDPAIGPDGSCYFLDNGILRAIGVDGGLRWETPLDPPLPGRPCSVDTEGRILFAGPGGLERYLASGTASSRWPTMENPPLGRLAFTPEGDAVYPASLRALVRLTAAGMETFAVGTGDGTGLGEPVVGPEWVFGSSNGDGVMAVDAAGMEQWRYRARSPGLVALADGGLVVGHSNRVVLLGRTGLERWQFEATAGNVTPPLLLTDGRLMFSAGPEVVVLQTDLQPAPGRWAMFRADPHRSGRAPVHLVARLVGLRSTAVGWVLGFRAPAGTSWKVETSKDLREWEALGGDEVAAIDGETTVELLSVSGKARFVRLRSTSAR